MTRRVQVRLTEEVYKKLSVWAEKTGVSTSQLGGLAVQAGLDSIIRAVSPADSMTVDQWEKVVQAFKNSGFDPAAIEGVKGEASPENNKAD